MTDHANSRDERKTKARLIHELQSMRQKVADSDRPPRLSPANSPRDGMNSGVTGVPPAPGVLGQHARG